MYGVYGDIIAAAERATEKFAETEELLEFPEVQADKAYYLSVLSRYNELKNIVDKLDDLKKVICSEQDDLLLLPLASSDEEREALYNGISSAKRKAADLASAISDALGRKHIEEKACGRFKLSAQSSKMGAELYSLIKDYLLSHGVKVESERSEYSHKGCLSGIYFTACGEDIISRLSPLTGAHKVNLPGGKTEELCFALSPISDCPTVSEDELKIDIFHSHGAGGQNINKVETAVRVTHIPSGLTVTCQDERSQLANKKRAVETLIRRLYDSHERNEKNRIEADIYAQYKNKRTPISFDLKNRTMTDTRLSAFTEVPFPPENFSSYIDGLISL